MANIIRHAGTARKVILDNGTAIIRQPKLFVKEWGAFVATTPYDDHFIYPTTEQGAAYKCTCGSSAVVVPPDPTGMFVCLFHSTYGKHQTSVVNKKDWNKLSGGTRGVK